MPEQKCYYELLGVPRDVADDGLKKAYRKMALKWHPDKNPDKVEECTKYFALIQTAYDVLSDKQERAWYDKHREAILRGGFGKDYEDDFMDVMQYMSPSAYSGFGDDDKGYYSTYRDVFAKIADEDIRYMDDEGKESDIPGFGDSQSSYEEVVHAFYAYWQSYRTSRSFIWVEEFDTREAPNRRVARLIEKDNKKKRDAAKKEWSQQVQLLVSYVKKKDKRVQAHRKLLEERAAERKRLEAERRDRERKERARLHEELAEEGQKVKLEMEAELKAMEATLNNEFGADSDDLDSDSQADSLEDELDDLFCIACNKSFKSPKAFANHENSKKHKENMVFLKAQMDAEEEEFGGEESQEEDYDLEDEEDEEEKEENEEEDVEDTEVKDDEEDDLDGFEMEEQAKENGTEKQQNKLSKKQKKKRRQQTKLLEQTEDVAEEEEEEGEEVIKLAQPSDNDNDDFPVKTKLSKKQKKKRRQQMRVEEEKTDVLEDLNMQPSDGDSGEEEFTKTKLSKKQKKRRRQQKQNAGNEEEEVEGKGVEDLLEKLETKTKPTPDDTRPEVTVEEPSLSADLQERLTLNQEPEEASSNPPPTSGNTKGKTKSKDNPSSAETSSNEPQICHTCSSKFPTRNKLFKHVKSTGHALRLSDDAPAGHHHNSSSSTKSSKKKKKHKGRNELE